MSDGRIEFDTGIDTEGINKAGTLIRNSFRRIAQHITKAFGSSGSAITQSFESATKAIEEQERKVEDLRKELEALEKERADSLASVPEMADAEFRGTEAGQALMGNAAEYKKALDEIIRRSNDTINKDYDAKAEKLKKNIKDATKEMRKMEKSSTSLGGKIRATFSAKVANNFKSALSKVSGALTGVFKKITAMASRVLIFNVINKALQKMQETMKGIFASDDRLANLSKDIRSNLYTAFQPIVEWLLPYFYKAMEAIRTITAMAAQVMAKAFHKDVNQMQGNAKKLQKQISDKNNEDAIAKAKQKAEEAAKKEQEKAEKERQKAAEKAAKEEEKKQKAAEKAEKAEKKRQKQLEKSNKSLAGFDEINQLGENAEIDDTEDAVEALTEAKDDLADMKEEISETKDEFSGMFDTDFGELSDKTNMILTYGMIIAGVALLVIGLATLNFPLILAGIALIKLGIEYGKSSGAFDNTPQWVKNVIVWGTMILGTILLVIGIVTLNIPMLLVGVGLLVTGIALGNAMGVFENTPAWVKQVITWGTMILGVVLIVVGLISTNPALLIAGIALMAVGVVMGNATGAFDALPSWVTQIITWGSMILGVVLMVVGISTMNIPLIIAGLAMVAAGVYTGVKSGAFKDALAAIKDLCSKAKTWFVEVWATLKEKFGNIVEKLKERIKLAKETLSTFGQNIKDFWIGVKDFIVEKAVNMFSTVKGKLSEWVTAAKNKITELWQHVKDKFSAIGQRISDTIVGTLKNAVNAILENIEDKVNWFIRMFNNVLDVINKIPGVDINRVDEVSLPRLASGTVVPANYGEFAAILGDNKRETEVVSPLSTIKQALSEALRENGGGTSEITIYLSTAEVTKAIVNKVNGQTQTSGVCPIKLKA